MENEDKKLISELSEIEAYAPYHIDSQELVRYREIITILKGRGVIEVGTSGSWKFVEEKNQEDFDETVIELAGDW